MRPIAAELLSGADLYRRVVLERMAGARESVWIATANVKAMLVEQFPAPGGRPRSGAGAPRDQAQSPAPGGRPWSGAGAPRDQAQPPAPPMGGRRGGRFAPVLGLFRTLARRGVELRLLHAELPSRPFRAAFDRSRTLVRGGLQMKICPRVHFKCVRVDGAWLYLGSANLTGAGLGAKHPDARNFELGLVTEDFDTVDRVSALFESIWSGAECGRCRLRAVCPDPIGPALPQRRKDDGIRLGRARRLRRR